MYDFTKRTVYDKVEAAVFTVCKEAIDDGNVEFLQRGLPILGIAEELDDKLDEDGEVVATTIATSAFNDADELAYAPKVLHLNKKLLDELTDDDIVNVIKKALHDTEEYITEANMVDLPLYLLDKEGLALDPTLIESKPFTEEEEEAVKTGSSTSIDLEALQEAIKSVLESLEEDVEEDKETTKASVDKYKMATVDPKTKTIVSKSNARYKSATIKDHEYESRIEQVMEIQDILDTAIESSGMSKTSSENPDKRINIRNIAIGHHKRFFSNKMVHGKRLKVVLVLDRSGSMSGAPARDSAILMTAFNNLTHKYKELTCTVIFSDDAEYDKMHFPIGEVNSRELLSFTNTHGAEGIAENMDKELTLLEDADVVFVYTDGDICSGNVDKPAYTAKGIELTGLYTAGSRSSTTKKLTNEDYELHYNKNKSWFHNVIVSSTATDLAEHMVDYMIN